MKNKAQNLVNKHIVLYSKKMVVFVVMIALNIIGLSAIGETICHFNDTEISSHNVFKAATLDFHLTNIEENEYIGVEANGELKFTTVVTQEADSLGIQYEITTEKISGNDNFCDGVDLVAKRNGTTEYSGKLLDFMVATSTEFGTWEFELNTPSVPGNFAHGDKCKVDFVFNGWRDDISESAQSSWDDEERFTLDLTARMIVLNEYLPNPVGNECSTNGEWVELFNNGNTMIDLNGWQIKDDAGHITTISTANTLANSTVIGAKNSGTEWLVVFLTGCILNNDGDSVNLYDSSDILIDTTSYSSVVPENKSNARIPDGKGVWVDPVPTPGGANKLEGESIKKGVNTNVSDVDTEAPVITVSGNNPAYVTLNSSYNDLGALVDDNINKNLGIHMGGDVDTTIGGEYEIIYTAIDGAGNIATVTRLVVVYDPIFGIPENEKKIETSFVEEVQREGSIDEKETISGEEVTAGESFEKVIDEEEITEEVANEEENNTTETVEEINKGEVEEMEISNKEENIPVEEIQVVESTEEITEKSEEDSVIELVEVEKGEISEEVEEIIGEEKETIEVIESPVEEGEQSIESESVIEEKSNESEELEPSIVLDED